MKPTPILLFVLLLFVACSKGKENNKIDTESLSPDSAAVVYYSLCAEGKYREYVEAMQSCDSTSATYRKQMELLLRHHGEMVRKEKNGVKSVHSLRSDLHDNGRMANVYLSVVYGDDSREEIIFSLVLEGNTWRIR